MKLQLRLTLLVGLVCTSLFTGCSQTTSLLNFNRTPMATAKDPVFEILGIWEPSEGQGPDGKPRRGCAGQILFMTRGKKTPVKVHGKITIHQFDDFGTPEEQAKPIHTFRFDGPSWNQHFGEGALGPSYSVFIPYMRDTSLETVCALRIKFKSDDGRETSSTVAKINIPGIDRQKQASATSEDGRRNRSVAVSTKRKIGEHLATVDRGRLRPVDAEKTARDQFENSTVQLAGHQEPAGASDAEINAIADKKIAELESKLDRLKKRKPSDSKSVLMNRHRFRTESKPTSRYRQAGNYGSLTDDE